MSFDERLFDFAETDIEREIVAAVKEFGGVRKASENVEHSYGFVQKHFKRVKERAAVKGYAPEAGLKSPIAEGFALKKYTLGVHPNGETTTWYKADADKERQFELAREAIDALASRLPALPKVQHPTMVDSDLMSVIPIADSHIGSYVFGPECNGQNYDTEEAVSRLCGGVDYLVKSQPQSERCLLINLGDALHADNTEGKTSRSGHILHLDTRMSRVIYMAMQAWKRCILSALEHHKHVDVINVSGNHDDILGMALRVSFGMLFEDNPRVTVHPSPADRQYIQHGEVLIGAVHGHQTKDSQLPGIMATERPKQWGETKHRYWFRGHHHHDSRKEYLGCIVEMVRTMAADDNYAVSHGFLSGNDMKAILMHKKYGEVSRTTCALEMLETAA